MVGKERKNISKEKRKHKSTEYTERTSDCLLLKISAYMRVKYKKNEEK